MTFRTNLNYIALFQFKVQIVIMLHYNTYSFFRVCEKKSGTACI